MENVTPFNSEMMNHCVYAQHVVASISYVELKVGKVYESFACDGFA